MFLVLKKKTLLIISAIILILALTAGLTATLVCMGTGTEASAAVVVLDAGHGGVDSGAKGVNSGVTEKELNLVIAKKVKALLEKDGIGVVLTRENGDGLYGDETKNMKKADMARRKEIINNAKPAVVVSIHGNKFPDKSRRGAQAFFEEMSDGSKELSNMLQRSLNTLNKEHLDREFEALKGNYYILKCSPYPSAIVEYGFLSNPDDDALLQKEEYRDQIAFAVYSGIKAYLTKNVSAITDEVTGI